MARLTLHELLATATAAGPVSWDRDLPDLPEEFEHGLEIGSDRRWVCDQCVYDDVLRRMLCTSSPGAPCDFCGEHSDAQAPVDVLFEYVYRSLLREFGDPSRSDLLWDKEEGWASLDELDTSDVLHAEGDPLGDDTELARLFVHTVTHDWHRLDSGVGSSDQRHLWSWDSFERRLLQGPRFLFSSTAADWGEASSEDLFFFLKTLANQLQTQLVKKSDAGLELFRARSNPERSYTSADDLGSPPPANAGPQRMSAAGVSCFYAAEDSDTALLEIRAGDTDRVSIGHWIAAAPLVYVDFAEHLALPSLFDYIGARNRPYIRFLHEFVKRVSRPKDDALGDANSYLATQVLSEFLRYQLPNPWRPGVDAVRFPSSVHEGGINWVVFGRPDRGDDPTLLMDGATSR